ncbi:ABC transporter ATP-binding protein [soil metagenome]
MKPPVFELIDVCKTYPMGESVVKALDHADVVIQEGEFCAVIGPSGSGKSTLMHIMGFMDQPTSGTLLFDGEDMSRLSSNARARVRNEKIGFVFQAFNLLPRLNVLENTALPLHYSHRSRREATQRARDALALVGLGDRADHSPSQLSGGQRQRVAIARALINRPRLILADEPTGNLDSENALLILDVIDKLHREGSTIVLVTHDPKVASRAARQIRVEDGKVDV